MDGVARGDGQSDSRTPLSTKVTLIAGDGIGPEITDATCMVLEAVGAAFDWDRQYGGVSAVETTGTPLPDATIESIRKNRLILKGPLTTPIGSGFRSVNVALRREFDLFANVRPVKSMVPGQRYDDIDLVLVRENTEGLYVGFETTIPVGEDRRAVAQSTAIVTRLGCERVIRYAFEYAAANDRRKVTICHKANILKAVSGLFLDVGRRVAEGYRGQIDVDDVIIDACAMKLVLDPHQFDVIVTTNMFGDILSDLMAGLVGGLGMAPGANIGKDAAMFEAVHGSAPDIAGKKIANPTALILGACMMLDHVGETDRANGIRTAIEATIREGKTTTPDLGGNASTMDFADAVCRRLR